MPKQLTPSRTADKYILRLPDGMRDLIATTAKTNNRTMNAEIVARLQNSFETEHSTESNLNTETIKKMLLDQEQHLEEKINNAMSELLKVLKP
jgi:hypothetical protein